MEPFEIVGLLNANDPDSGENGTVIYRLQQTHEFFELKRSGQFIVQNIVHSLFGATPKKF